MRIHFFACGHSANPINPAVLGADEDHPAGHAGRGVNVPALVKDPDGRALLFRQAPQPAITGGHENAAIGDHRRAPDAVAQLVLPQEFPIFSAYRRPSLQPTYTRRSLVFSATVAHTPRGVAKCHRRSPVLALTHHTWPVSP